MLQVTSDNLLLELYLSGNFMAKPLKLFPLFYAYYKKILMLLWDKLAIAHALTLCMAIPSLWPAGIKCIVPMASNTNMASNTQMASKFYTHTTQCVSFILCKFLPILIKTTFFSWHIIKLKSCLSKN